VQSATGLRLFSSGGGARFENYNRAEFSSVGEPLPVSFGVDVLNRGT
jgi:hypothetical protein